MPGATFVTTLTATKATEWLWGVFGFCLIVAYWPHISGAATTSRWDVAAVLAVVLFMAPRVTMTAAHWFGLVLLGWLALTLSWETGDARLDGVNEVFQLGITAVAFAVGSITKDLRPLFVGCAVGIGLNSVIAEYQWCGGHGIVETIYGGDAGLFVNVDRLAAAAAMTLIGLMVTTRLWALLLLPLPSLILAQSRAAWLAIIVAIIVMVVRSTRWRIVALSALAICGGVYLAIHGIDGAIAERIAIWRDTIPSLTFCGNGLGSFREGFIAHAQSYDFARFLSRPEHPHNEGLWLAYEGGVCAVVLAGAFVVCIVRRGAQTGQLAILVAFGVLALFAMPLHDPATACLAALVAGHCAGRRDRVGGAVVDERALVCDGLASARHQGQHGKARARAGRVSVPATVS